MNVKKILTAAVVAAGILVAGTSAADAPPLGTEQFEEWYDSNGNLNGYVHWTCNGDRVVWGTRTGTLRVSRRACG